MASSDKSDRPSRIRAAAAPWISGRRRRVRADGLPASPKPTARRILRLAAGGLSALCLLGLGVWLAILYMPLPASQVIPRVKAAIEERLGPSYTVAIEDAQLRRGANGVELRLVDLAIAEAGGPVVASVPRAELTLDGFGLLSGEARVRRVHVTNPRLDMRFDMAVDAASKNSDLPDRIMAAIGDLDRLLGADGAASALEEVDVTGATVLVAPRARAPLSLEGVDLKLTRGAGGSLALAASSAKADNRWTTAVTVTAPAADQARTIDLGLENIDLAPIRRPSPRRPARRPSRVASRAISTPASAPMRGSRRARRGSRRAASISRCRPQSPRTAKSRSGRSRSSARSFSSAGTRTSASSGLSPRSCGARAGK